MGSVIDLTDRILDESKIRWLITVKSDTNTEFSSGKRSKDGFIIVMVTYDFNRIPGLRKRALEELKQKIRNHEI